MMNKVVSSNSCVQATAMGAIAGRATRACDMCGIQRARWYCAADEAYLCARCDTSVHGANTLALRHDRICLAPTHLHGFTPSAGGSLQQKAAFKLRSTTTTSRSSTIPSKTASKNGDGVSEPDESPAVAAAGQDLLPGHHEDDPREISTPPRFKTSASAGNILQGAHYYSRNSASDSSRFSPFFKSKAAAQAHAQLEDDQWGSDDAAAAEDHENFLLVPDCGCLDSGIDICCDVDGTISLVEDASVHVKIKEEKNRQQQEEEIKTFSSSSKDQQLQQLDSSSSKADESGASTEFESATEFEGFRSPDFGPRDIMCDEFGLDFDFPVLEEDCLLGLPGTTTATDGEADFDRSHGGSEAAAIGGIPAAGEDVVVGRQARVLRYKEKRLTRLFSKTIRYQVRKLNAERRPRMKGRFVKRTSVNS
ncbi:unnamed protein product [Sphagnum jensenii]|uniref:Uncharacterized protein n=1 Tax=Sphagnum jensenii TaxID=128206 RepID=A0ABP1ACS0_9BRYO